MSKENETVEDDFDGMLQNDADGGAPSAFDETHDDGLISAQVVQSAMADLGADEGGSHSVPAISALAFCETGRVASLIKSAAADRRMQQAKVSIHSGGLQAAIAFLQNNATPNLIILESTGTNKAIVSQIDKLASHCDEGVQVIVVAAVNDISLYRELMTRGVSEYLVPPITPAQFVRSVANLFSDPETPFIGKSVAVFGAKGGVGSSILSHNLAWCLSEHIQVNTSLLDLDLAFGTTSLDFNFESPQTIADALLAPERVDTAIVTRLLAKKTERLSLFIAPASVVGTMDIAPEAYGTVIDAVRHVMPYVVLDVPHAWDAWTYHTLINSDEVILVCQPDLVSLRNGKNIIDQLREKRPNDNPPRLIMNMTGVPKRPEIPVKDFAATIGVQPEIIVPFDAQLFGNAMNNGQMVCESDRNSEAAQAIMQLAGSLSGREAAQEEKKSFLKKILKK